MPGTVAPENLSLLHASGLSLAGIRGSKLEVCNSFVQRNAENPCGGVGERLKPAVLKTVRPQKGLVGSNPTPSAIQPWSFSPPAAQCQETMVLRGEKR